LYSSAILLGSEKQAGRRGGRARKRTNLLNCQEKRKGTINLFSKEDYYVLLNLKKRNMRKRKEISNIRSQDGISTVAPAIPRRSAEKSFVGGGVFWGGWGGGGGWVELRGKNRVKSPQQTSKKNCLWKLRKGVRWGGNEDAKAWDWPKPELLGWEVSQGKGTNCTEFLSII